MTDSKEAPEKILFKRLQELAQLTFDKKSDKIKSFYELFSLIIEEATAGDYINFTTLFSRLSYLGTKRSLPRTLLSYCHQFRKAIEQKQVDKAMHDQYIELAHHICGKLCQILWNEGATIQYKLSSTTTSYFEPISYKKVATKSFIAGLIFEIDEDKKTFSFFDDDDPTDAKNGRYDIIGKNDLFTANFTSLLKTFVLPQHVNLIHVEIDDEQNYIPKAIVIAPDHMCDVTSIAECFKDHGAEPFLYLISKFKSLEATKSLMVGNMVNVMLDELINNQNIAFTALFQKLFLSNPIGLAALDDIETKEILETLEKHFNHLKHCIRNAFPDADIRLNDIYLEPAFYSRDYGIQGRLDVLHMPKDQKTYDIIELKSGKIFKPNAYGINESHYIQTLLYDLLTRSVFGRGLHKNFILYSREEMKNLRHAVPILLQQYEALKLRNDLLAIEQKLKKANEDNAILRYIKQSNFPKLKGFNIQDVILFENIYNTLDDVEKSYFNHFVAFISREQSKAKTGEHGVYKSNGHAALWLESDEEKKDRFALLSSLTILENFSNQDKAIITFSKSEEDESLVNLRVGDIGVLYPMIEGVAFPILKSQIFKCSITSITSRTIQVKLRNKQNNQQIFEQYTQWTIEQDSLDSVFNSMYRSLYAWASAPIEYRKLILGRIMPQAHNNKSIDRSGFDDFMTNTQKDLLAELINAEDYYLLWGPPGTGKTSLMLKNAVKYYYYNTRKNILLLAYTNRAVDEITEAILSIDNECHNQLVRLGSATSTQEKFVPYLLDERVKNINRRQDVLDLINNHRIYISTVSSIINRPDVFALKEFDIAIIDEASQIIEPLLVGFLNRFKKFVLIGDHKQLPAVVVQNKQDTAIHDTKLTSLGIIDTRDSLFERMYLQSISRNDTSRIGILSEQGRMHIDLMAFPNQYFYNDQLAILPENDRQNRMSFLKNHDSKLLGRRMTFFPTPVSTESNWKTNELEADEIVNAILALKEIYRINNIPLSKDSIGIIAPYRAQLALIRNKMEKSDAADLLDRISIDTVERYQGGARDIIIISFCVNRLSQLDSLVSLSSDGTDRKLNVALTRAKEHIIMYGNEEILSQDVTYAALIDKAKVD